MQEECRRAVFVSWHNVLEFNSAIEKNGIVRTENLSPGSQGRIVRKRLCHVAVGAVHILIFLPLLASLEISSGSEQSIRSSEYYTTNSAHVAAPQPYLWAVKQLQ